MGTTPPDGSPVPSGTEGRVAVRFLTSVAMIPRGHFTAGDVVWVPLTKARQWEGNGIVTILTQPEAAPRLVGRPSPAGDPRRPAPPAPDPVGIPIAGGLPKPASPAPDATEATITGSLWPEAAPPAPDGLVADAGSLGAAPRRSQGAPPAPDDEVADVLGGPPGGPEPSYAWSDLLAGAARSGARDQVEMADALAHLPMPAPPPSSRAGHWPRYTLAQVREGLRRLRSQSVPDAAAPAAEVASPAERVDSRPWHAGGRPEVTEEASVPCVAMLRADARKRRTAEVIYRRHYAEGKSLEAAAGKLAVRTATRWMRALEQIDPERTAKMRARGERLRGLRQRRAHV